MSCHAFSCWLGRKASTIKQQDKPKENFINERDRRYLLIPDSRFHISRYFSSYAVWSKNLCQLVEYWLWTSDMTNIDWSLSWSFQITCLTRKSALRGTYTPTAGSNQAPRSYPLPQPASTCSPLTLNLKSQMKDSTLCILEISVVKHFSSH